MTTWTIPVPMQLDESISSWLARAALAQGCDPLALTGAIWPGWRVWSLDPDRGIPEEKLGALSEVSGISVSDFQRAALHDDVEKIAGASLPNALAWPWVLALGSRNRKKRGWQQYCPACLAQDAKPYFRRGWRFAWHIGCQEHESMLLDRCPACGAHVDPHLLLAEDRCMAFCSHCKADLRKTSSSPVRKEAQAFQRMADDTLSKGEGTFGGQQISLPDWFATVHFFIGLIRRASIHDGSKLAGAIRLLGIHLAACRTYV